MGLDMYAFATPQQPDKPVDFGALGEPTLLHYWRKHPNLHGWMEALYRDKDGEAVHFNCVNLQLTASNHTPDPTGTSEASCGTPLFCPRTGKPQYLVALPAFTSQPWGKSPEQPTASPTVGEPTKQPACRNIPVTPGPGPPERSKEPYVVDETALSRPMNSAKHTFSRIIMF